MAWLLSLPAMAVAVLSGLVALGVALTGLFHAADEALYDQMLTRLVPPPETPSVILVAIDEPSLAEIGPWPWPRSVHGTLVQALRAQGAQTIAFDVLFADPKDFADDALMVGAMAEDVVLARDVEVLDTPQGRLRQEVLPLPELLAFGARTGSVAIPIDPDGAMRRMPPDGSFTAEIAGKVAPPDGTRIAYAGPPGSYPRVSYYQALAPETYLPPGFFAEADVIVGFALRAVATLDSSTPDHFRTPWAARGAGLMPGIEVHANALDTLRLDRGVSPTPAWLIWVLSGALGFGAARAVAGRPAGMAAVLTLTLAASPAAAAALALPNQIWLAPAAPMFGAFLGGLAQTLRDYTQERSLRRAVTDAFGRYLAPSLVARLAADSNALKLGGERREITVMFCDIRGFTAISESMRDDPEGLTQLVNRMLTPIADAILANEGTIDKFIGDCVMGIWNAPLDIPGHQHKAVAAGFQILSDFAALAKEINAERQAKGQTPIDLAVGVGVNSGLCVVGNMGTATRFDYTAIGDAVNLSARLEARTKYYGVTLIVGAATAEATPTGQLVEIDMIAVKGQQNLVKVFTGADVFKPAAGSADEGAQAQVHTQAQAAALAAYRAQDWERAHSLWTDIAAQAPQAQTYCAVMRSRTEMFKAKPPTPEWDGGWRFDEK